MSCEKNQIFLVGNGPYLNRGCEAIVRGTTRLLREQLGECNFISHYFPRPRCKDAQLETDPFIFHRPFPLLKRYTFPWAKDLILRRLFNRSSRVEHIAQIFDDSLRESRAKMVLMLGGDNYNMDLYKPKIFFRLNSVALAHKLPVILWGASVGPFSSDPQFERWAAQELQKVSLICARETETLDYLVSIGLERNVVLASDPAFFLEPVSCELPASIDRILKEGCIGLNLSPLLRHFLQDGGESLSRWVQVAADVLQGILQLVSAPVLLIPHVTSGHNDINRDDYLFLQRIAQLVGESDRIFVLGADLNAAQTKWVIGQTRIFAGARTHSTLAAISSGVPTICVGYSIKARGIAKDVYGNIDWLVDSKELVDDPGILAARLLSLWRCENDVRSHLADVLPIFRDRARKATRLVVDIAGIG